MEDGTNLQASIHFQAGGSEGVPSAGARSSEGVATHVSQGVVFFSNMLRALGLSGPSPIHS